VISRRSFLAASALPLAATPPRLDAARLRNRIEDLSVFGRPRGGTFADGVSRIGYSDTDITARRFVMNLMREAGAAPRIDAAGNIFCRRDGAENSLPAVLFGSHIDSVPDGGNFDGDLGSLASVEILRLMQEHGLRTRRPLEAVVWACEEATFRGNSLNGSRAAAGRLRPGEIEEVWAGLRKADAIRRIGGDPERIAEARISPGRYHTYVELHIEQGGTLARDGVPIGVVDGIVSIDRHDVVIRGMANHAGTTPMADRQDALIAASRLTLAVREVVTAEPGSQVGTVGHLAVTPNAANVIPGLVNLTIELRDLSSDKLDRIAARIRARAEAIAGETRTSIQMTAGLRNPSALADAGVQKVIESAAHSLGLRARRLPSGAGHDAQMMATVAPMGMIFVPSVAGISHSPKEFTAWEDCAHGADVLFQTVVALAA